MERPSGSSRPGTSGSPSSSSATTASCTSCSSRRSAERFARHTMPASRSAFRTSPRRGKSSSRRVSSSTATFSTPACVTWPSSRIPTETSSCCTAGMHRVIDVQRTDFVAVPTRDRERAAAFYGETLGLRKNQTSDTWIEFETGNLTLSLVAPEEVGIEFAPLPFGTTGGPAPDVAAGKEKLERWGVELVGEPWDARFGHGAAFKDP